MTQIQRPLNKKEQTIALLMCANIHLLIRQLDDLKDTSLYRQKIKASSNLLLKELEAHQRVNLWTDEVEGSNRDKAVDQMEYLSQMQQNMMVTTLGLDSLPISQQRLFWLDMNKAFRRYNMPLMLTHEGDLIFR